MTYTVKNQLNLDEIAGEIIKHNSKTHKYKYIKEQIMAEIKDWPKKGDTLHLENAQNTCCHTRLFHSWGTWNVGYTWCIGLVKDKNTRTVKLSLSKQQTIGRKFYNISPLPA